MVSMIRRVMLIAIENPNADHLDRMRRCLLEAPKHVEGIVESVVSDALPINNSPSTLVWDTVFADQAAIDRYRDHPYHTGAIRDVFTEVQFTVMSAFVNDPA
jgi:hypothetical protein